MAMILLGFRSFLLLILGKYQYITGAIKAPFADESMLIIAVFGSGATIGIIGFSKLLKCAGALSSSNNELFSGSPHWSSKDTAPWKTRWKLLLFVEKPVLREENFYLK